MIRLDYLEYLENLACKKSANLHEDGTLVMF